VQYSSVLGTQSPPPVFTLTLDQQVTQAIQLCMSTFTVLPLIKFGLICGDTCHDFLARIHTHIVTYFYLCD
jgi:hypothetical protein